MKLVEFTGYADGHKVMVNPELVIYVTEGRMSTVIVMMSGSGHTSVSVQETFEQVKGKLL